MDETEKIKIRYESRKTDSIVIKNSANAIFSKYVVNEREQYYSTIIKSHFCSLEIIKLLEIGAGEGGNIPFFHKLGFLHSNIYANELLDERMCRLKEKFSGIHHLPGDALNIESRQQFDVVFQSTVFTSILDDSFKKELAAKMFDLTKNNGIILWYDFTFNNPKNKDVKGVSKKEIIDLFPHAKKITFKRVTLAPPIGRRIGRMYGFINDCFPFLRTHIIAVIEK